MLVVLKVSGHLYRLQSKVRELMDVAASIVDSGVGIAVVPGGSVFADAVRSFQRSSGVDDDVAHWMAIKAMEVYGLFIKSSSLRAVEVYDLDDVTKAVKEGLVPIVMPYKILKEHDELPHSWAVTSDSISVYIAHLLKANLVVLGKMMNGTATYSKWVAGAVDVDRLPSSVKVAFDDYVPVLIRRYRIPLALFDVAKPWILYSIVKAKPDDYILITS